MKREMKNSIYKSYDELPLFLNADTVAKALGIAISSCYELLKDIHNTFGKNILVPMTMLRRSTYGNIIEKLLADNIDTRLVVLEAGYQSVHDRILARGEEEGCWCMENIELARRESSAIREGLHLDTDGRSVEELAEMVLSYIS